MKRLLLLCVCVAAALVAFGAGSISVVTNAPGFYENDDNAGVQKITVGTTHQTAYPTSVGNPIFWLDCNDTSAWTVDANGNVTRLTSRIGSRYMVSARESGVVDAMAFDPVAPVLVQNALNGRAVLDFGKKGSKRCLLFDKVAGDTLSTNVLYNIGSIVAVWYSAIGDSTYGGADGLGKGNWGEGGYYGGALLGGGYGSKGDDSDDRSQYVLYRGTANARQLNGTDTNRPRWYDNIMANASHTHYAIRKGLVRHNGQTTSALHAGFAADWEVISLIPNLTYGTMNATGLCMNDSRISAVSGGFKVAEMLIYDHALTEAETKLVEAYLNDKWFGRVEPGFNGHAQVGRLRSLRHKSGKPVGPKQEIEVGGDDRLTVGKLQGGRGFSATLTKTGAGALALADAHEYGGDIRLEAGTLEVDRRAIPVALPHTAFIHFDPSDAASFKTNALGQFVSFSNLVATSGYKINSIWGRADAYVPAVLANELGPGKHVLDFGDVIEKTYDHMLYFTTNETLAVSEVKAKPEGFCTAFLVVGAQRGGGSFVKTTTNSGYFCRRNGTPCRFDVGLLTNYSIDCNIYGDTYDTVYLNGIPVRPDQGFEGTGYQVVAIRAAGSISCEGLVGSPWGSGGGRIAEVVLYTRALTEEELRDGSAYLMKKWLGKVAPGYADDFTGHASADYAKVTLAGGALDVKSGNAVKIRELSTTTGALASVPGATLAFAETDATNICLRGGTLNRAAAMDVSSASEAAGEPILHLDADDADSMRLVEVSGEKRVQEWYSQNDRTVLATANFKMYDNDAAYNYDAYTPYLSETVTLNDRPVIDFGPFNGSTAAAAPYTGRARSFVLSKPLDNVRHAFIVWATRDDSRGNFFGCSQGTGTAYDREFYDFLRSSDTSTNNASLLNGNATSQALLDGKIYTNGVEVAYSMIPKPGSFMMAEFVPTAPVHISSIGNDRDAYRFSGGIYVAEILLYDRKLTVREQTATRNYLGKKWFNAEPTALPAVDAETLEIAKLDVTADTQTDLGNASLAQVTGSATDTLTGDNEVTVLDTTAFTGTFDVRQGTLRLTGAYPETVGELVKEDEILFHADSTWGVQTVTNEDGVFVSKWLSRAGNGWAAIPFWDGHPNPARKGMTKYYPRYTAADGLNGLPVVDLGKSGNEIAMLFTQNDVTNLLTHIGSVFWVVDTQNGGGYLLGGGHHGGNWTGGLFNWMRGGAGGRCYDPTYPILSDAWVCPDIIKNGLWRLDGTQVAPTTDHFNGSWELVSMVMKSTATDWTSANADGFGFDGRTLQDMDFTSVEYGSYMGCQRFAEVVIYSNRLTEAECAQVEAHLRAKWRFRGTLPATDNAVAVTLASDATLDLDGKSAYLKSLSGTGVVTNGTLRLGELVADFANVGHLENLPQFDASVTNKVIEGQKVILKNFVSGEVVQVPILVSADLLDTEFLRSAVFETEDGSALPNDTIARLRYDEATGLLYADIRRKPGLCIIIR